MLCTLHGLHPVGAEEAALNATVQAVFERLDVNGDHKVTFDDFLHALQAGRASSIAQTLAGGDGAGAGAGGGAGGGAGHA